MNDHSGAGLQKCLSIIILKELWLGKCVNKLPNDSPDVKTESWEYANLWVMNMCSLNPEMVAITHTTPAKTHFILNWMNIWINIDDINVVECLINDLCVRNLDCMVENGIMLILMSVQVRTSQPGWKVLSSKVEMVDLGNYSIMCGLLDII